MAARILTLVGQQNYLYGFDATLRDHSFELRFTSTPAEAEVLFKNMDPSLILFTGEVGTELYQSLKIMAQVQPKVPVVAVVTDEVADIMNQDWGERVHTVRPLTSRGQFLAIVRRLIHESKGGQKSVVNLKSNPPQLVINPHFFDTLDIHEVFGQALKHLGSRVLCKNIHWVQWSELQHLARVDSESLDLEVETKYHRTPKLRSLHDENVRHIVHLARSFPLVKKLPHLAEGHFLLKRSQDSQHLLFPIRESSGNRNLSCLLIENLHDGEPEYVIKQVRDALKNMVRHIEFAYELWEAKNLSFMDDLTDLYNQRYLPMVLDTEIARAKRACTKFSVLFMDLDHFKKVNDNKGHFVGSQLLIEMGKIVKENVRSCDYGFRYGGDEFVILLVDTDATGAQVVAERLRRQVEESTFLVDGHTLRLTVSVGVACYPDHAQTRQEVIKMADEAMYHGKHKSRNVVYVAS